jgi:hypothetical protein
MLGSTTLWGADYMEPDRATAFDEDGGLTGDGATSNVNREGSFANPGSKGPTRIGYL